MAKKSLRERFQELAGIHKTLIKEQVIEGQWVNFYGNNTDYNPDVPGGQGINTACVYGCMDPDANNYDPNATCWGDQNGVMSTQSLSGPSPYNGIAYGPAYCTYGYSCDTFGLWLNKLYELGLANQLPPFGITPTMWPSSVEGMAQFICGGEPGSPEACAENGGVCFSDLQYNPGQYCPACFTQYNWGTDGTGSPGGVDMCDCCCPGEGNSNPGCTDQNALNYNPYATTDDGSCIYEGCTDPDADNYDPEADVDDGSCCIYGCMDPDADNFNDSATCDDGCLYEGCMDPDAYNYDENANVMGNCLYEGCTDSGADNFDPNADIDDGSCLYPEDLMGCMDEEAANYDPDAEYPGEQTQYSDENGCVYLGCMDDGTLDDSVYPGISALNYDPTATFGPPISAGMLQWSNEVNGGGIIDIPQCIYPEIGCTDEEAVNYDSDAEADDGSCYYEVECYICDNPSDSVLQPDVLISEIFYINPNVGDDAYGILNSCPQEGQYAYGPNTGGVIEITDNWSDEPLDCGGGHEPSEGKIECYQCEYPIPAVLGQAGEVVSQIFYFTVGGEDDTGCPEDWFGSVEELETNENGVPCGPDPIDPEVDDELTRWRCKIATGECFEVPYDEGVYDTEEECYEKGHCGEERVECYKCKDGGPVGWAFWIDMDETLPPGHECPKGWQTTWEDLECEVACYKCKGNAPVGYMFDNPPGCPKGWQETYEDLRCNECEDNPLIDQWLNLPQVISTHCCEVYLVNPNNSSGPGPQCYGWWDELGGNPNIDPHECCPTPSTDG